MGSYDRFLAGQLEDYAYPQEKIEEAIAELPRWSRRKQFPYVPGLGRVSGRNCGMAWAAFRTASTACL